jgi:integrase
MGVTLRFHRGAWWIFIRHHNKRTSKRIGTDKTAALRIKKEMEERLARTDLHLPGLSEPGMTVKQYGELWLAGAGAGLKASTRRFYTEKLTNHIYPELGTHPIAKVTRAEVKRLIDRLTGKKLGPKTITGVIRTLSTMLSEAVEDGRLPANPALRPGRLRRRFRDPNAPKLQTIDPYTRTEAEILVDTAATHYPEWQPFLLCALRTGMRLGELRALQWGSIDWRQRFIRVERNFVEGAFTTPKNGTFRNVDMSLQLRTALRLWRRRQRASWMSRGRPLPELVFPSDVETPLDDSRVRKAIAAIVTKAELRKRKSVVHVLRHTFGSLLIQQGESLSYVRDQMGHASIQITVDVYGSMIPGGNRSAVDRLDAGASDGIPAASGDDQPIAVNARKLLKGNGEPRWNRTINPQIKSPIQPVETPNKSSNSRKRRGKP